MWSRKKTQRLDRKNLLVGATSISLVSIADSLSLYLIEYTKLAPCLLCLSVVTDQGQISTI